MITAGGDRYGVLAVHRAEPGAWLGPGRQAALDCLAREPAGWRSWYRRTVVLDTLEYLHAHGGPGA